MARVLVVDDTEVVRRIVGRVLTAAGHQVLCAPDGAAALDLVHGGGVDLVVTDLRMPTLSGVATIDALRRLAPGTAVIVMSGEHPIEVIGELYRAGIGDEVRVVAKPFTVAELTHAVDCALRERDPPRARERR